MVWSTLLVKVMTFYLEKFGWFEITKIKYKMKSEFLKLKNFHKVVFLYYGSFVIAPELLTAVLFVFYAVSMCCQFTH